jgi:hypothetical protein
MVFVVAAAGSLPTGPLGTTIYNDHTNGLILNSFSAYAAGASPTKTLGDATATTNMVALNLKQAGRAALNILTVAGHTASPQRQVTSGALVSTGISVSSSDPDRAVVVIAQFGSSNAGTVSAIGGSVLNSGTNFPTTLTVLGGPFANGTVGDIYVLGGVVIYPVANLPVTVTWTGAAQVDLSVYYFAGAAQNGGTTTFNNLTSNTGTATLSQVSLTIPANQKAVAGFMSVGNYSAVAAGSTDAGFDNTMASWAVAASYQTSSGAQSVGYTGASGNFVGAAVCVKAA